MKNPNGYGSVVKLSGNRRNPYAVRKTIGFNEKGHPIYVFIGYTPTREEGLVMLAKYNSDPYSLDDINVTVAELYRRWLEVQSGKMSKALKGSMQSAWKHCSSVYDMKYRTLKSYDIQKCIDNCNRSCSTKAAIKNLFSHLDRFALELDIITRQRSVMVTVPTAPETKRKPFSAEELKTLWDNKDIAWADTVLIYIYTGMRISELLSLKKTDVDLDEMTITGGTKTASGKNRIIPIHARIQPFIKKYMEQSGEYLVTLNGERLTKSRYYTQWGKVMAYLRMEHTPHECRHTFRSMLDSAEANKRCIDLIMGHKSKDVGERVYTHKTVDELRATVALLE